MTRMIVGFAGRIGSGKSTAAAELSKTGGFQRVRFAGTLKKMMVTLGLSLDEIDGDRKEKPCALLCGKTPRHAMQTIGTEWGRDLIGEDVWVNAWKHAVSKLPETANVVVDDVRFANEAQAIRDMGGIVVLVERGITSTGNHASEAINFETDFVLDNTSDLDTFKHRLGMMLLGMLEGEKHPVVDEPAECEEAAEFIEASDIVQAA
jgi:hypothetical protein